MRTTRSDLNADHSEIRYIFTTENHIEHSENGCYDKCYYGEYYQLFDMCGHIAICLTGLSVDRYRESKFPEFVCGQVYGCQNISEFDIIITREDIIDSQIPVKTMHRFFQYLGDLCFHVLPTVIQTECISLGRNACKIFG